MTPVALGDPVATWLVVCDYVSWGWSGDLTYACTSEAKESVARARRAAALRAEATYAEPAPWPSS